MIMQNASITKSSYRYLYLDHTPPTSLNIIFNYEVSHKKHVNVLLLGDKEDTDLTLQWLEQWLKDVFVNITKNIHEYFEYSRVFNTLVILNDLNTQTNRYTDTHLRQSRKTQSPVLAAMPYLSSSMISYSTLLQFDIAAQVIVRYPLNIIELHTYAIEDGVDLTKKPMEIIALTDIHKIQ